MPKQYFFHGFTPLILRMGYEHRPSKVPPVPIIWHCNRPDLAAESSKLKSEWPHEPAHRLRRLQTGSDSFGIDIPSWFQFWACVCDSNYQESLEYQLPGVRARLQRPDHLQIEVRFPFTKDNPTDDEWYKHHSELTIVDGEWTTELKQALKLAEIFVSRTSIAQFSLL